MNDIFGIPLDGIMVVLAVTLVLCLLSVAWIAIRRPVIFKLGVRNIPRHKAQSLLIILGLMLSTMIIAAALGTGDTVYHSITSDVYTNLGQVDELVVASQDVNANVELTAQEGLDPSALATVEAALANDPNVAGIMPILEARAPVRNQTSELAEPDVVLIGLDPSRISAFNGPVGVDGNVVDLQTLDPGEVIVSQKLAGEIDAETGDLLLVYINDVPQEVTVAGLAKDSYLSGTRRGENSYLEFPGMAMTITGLQELTGRTGEMTAIAITNAGNERSGVDHSDAVTDALRLSLSGTGLGVKAIKQDRVDSAEQIGSAFTQIFVLLGLFSVISGVLLIVLIFTMLASERRSEMGMERAIGAHRSQLVQQFISEGLGYALFAGLIGALLGLLAAFGIAQGMRVIFGSYAPIEAHITLRSLIVAYCLGMFITFLTVVAASWKISRVNIVAAVRDLPEIVVAKRRLRTLIWGIVLLVSGALFSLVGSSGETAAMFAIGMSLLPFGIALIAQFFGLPGRIAFTLVGIWLLTFSLLPESTFNSLFGNFKFGLEMFFISGIFMVIGATLIIVQNTDVLLAGVSLAGGLFRGKLPAVRTGVAYPGAARGRTGLTIAMFSLIIFSIVMIATMNHNYVESALGGEADAGWDLRADVLAADPPADVLATLSSSGVDISGVIALGTVTNPSEFVSSVRLSNTEEWKSWPVLGMDERFLETSEIEFGQIASGYASGDAVIQALLNEPDVAVIDSFAVPAEGNIGGDDDLFQLTGLKSGDKTFDPITVELQNPVDGSSHEVTIIGIIDTKIGSLAGLFANQKTIDAVYPGETITSWYMRLDEPDQADELANQIESALLESGVQATSISSELQDQQREESGFLYIIEGFMALGLFVGMAAIGVIAFRSVVERRQQIGVLRAIGFRHELVSLSFMIETLFVVVTGVVTGTALGLLLTKKLVADPDQGFSSDVSFVIPWPVILTIAVVAVAVALLMTWIPSRQAGRIAPAEALRYE